MKTKILSYVAQEINRLTSDEDIRQELWVYLLEGHSPFSLEDRLTFIINKRMKDNSIITYMDMETLNGLKKKL